MIFCDAHMHLCSVAGFSDGMNVYSDGNEYFVCASNHTEVEWNKTELIVSEGSVPLNGISCAKEGSVPLNGSSCAKEGSVPVNGSSFVKEGSVPVSSNSCAKEGSVPVKIIKSFGILPQEPDRELIGFLEKLLEEDKIDAVGEAGFDFFTEEYKKNDGEQKYCFEKQLELAEKYGKTVVIHNRKALDVLFEYKKNLARLPAVVFHGFAYGPNEAESIVAKGINAYFSFGKQILNGNKKSILCVEKLLENRILFETDAPFQKLKGELFTDPADIKKVYEKACEIRKMSMDELCEKIKINYLNAYGLN